MGEVLPFPTEKRAYRKGKEEDFSSAIVLRITPAMEQAIEKFMAGDGKLVYDSRSDLIRDAIFQQLDKLSKSSELTNTVLARTKMLSMAIQEELTQQRIADVVTALEHSLMFYLTRDATDKLREIINEYGVIIKGIKSAFWREYLLEQIQSSPIVQKSLEEVYFCQPTGTSPVTISNEEE